MTITHEFTDTEVAAILALGIDADVQAFADRHLQHQADFAVSQAKEAVQAQYDKLPPAEKAKIDAILDANSAKGGKP